MLSRLRRVTIAITAGALLAGCGTAMQGSVTPSIPTALPGQTWLKANAASKDLVYVSNVDGEVTVYDYATRTLVGILANFEAPGAECVDKNQNIYIADTQQKKIFEYAHGGTKVIKTLDDSPYMPSSCSVDSVTGMVAVGNSAQTGSSSNVSVYPAAGGKPRVYTDSEISSFLGCAYDSHGSLLVSGFGGSGYSARFAWLPKNVAKLINIGVPGPKGSWKWYGVTGIQWDGQFFALDSNDVVYQVALIHGQAYYVGETQLGASYIKSQEYGIYVPNPNRQGTQVLAGYDDSYSSAVYYFPYPAGGGSDGSLTQGVDSAYSIVVSLRK